MPAEEKDLKNKVVYTIVDCGNGRSKWLAIGTARVNADGSISAQLDALPRNGTLNIRGLPPEK